MERVCECASHLQVTQSCQFSSQFQLGNLLWMQKSPGKRKSCPSICLVSHWDCVSVFSVSSILQQGGFQAIGFVCWHVYLVLEEAVNIRSPCVLPATVKLSRAASSLSSGLDKSPLQAAASVQSACSHPCPSAASAAVGKAGWEPSAGPELRLQFGHCFKHLLPPKGAQPAVCPASLHLPPTAFLCSYLVRVWLSELPESPKITQPRGAGCFSLGEGGGWARGTIQQAAEHVWMRDEMWDLSFLLASSCSVHSTSPTASRCFLFGCVNAGSLCSWAGACSGRRWALNEWMNK